MARLERALAPLMNVATAAVLLRIFLGGTMLYAGLDKVILDPRFLQADGVGSIGDTLRLFVTAGGPLAPLVQWTQGVPPPATCRVRVYASPTRSKSNRLQSIHAYRQQWRAVRGVKRGKDS
mgnify:CR=1 FL=1